LKELCVTTTVDEKYEAYIPLFIYCFNKAYPEHDLKIYYRGDISPHFEKYCAVGENVVEGFGLTLENNIATTPSIRFLVPQVDFEDYRYTLFTDIDILFRREPNGIVAPHLKAMEKNHLECYENIMLKTIRGPSMPGVHFVTREWWPDTAQTRVQYWQDLYENPNIANYKGFDEYMLYNMHLDSNLPLPNIGHDSWRLHGIHLGAYRNKNSNPPISTVDNEFLRELWADADFVELYNICRFRNKIVYLPRPVEEKK